MEPNKEPNMDDTFEEILQRAAELGKAIRRHPRYVKLREADSRVRADKAATDALDAYNKAAAALGRKEQSGQPIEVEEKRSIERLHQAVAANETIKAFMRTHADYAELMRRMNNAILEAIGAEGGEAKKP